MMKVGRNDPCPCGSGKKYKKCCIPDNVSTPEELHYRRLSGVYDTLLKQLLQHAARVFGPDGFAAALREFWGWPDSEEEAPDAEARERQMLLFCPWFVFNWEYDPRDEEFELTGPPERTVAELYAADRGAQLDPLESALIEAVNRKPYSFWEVLNTEPGKRMRMQEILTGSQITVEERSGSRCVKAADIVFGRAVTVEGVGMILGLSPFIILPSHKPALIDLRRMIRGKRRTLTEDDLNEWEFEIRQTYLDLDRVLHTPPQLHNSDGDPLEMHKLVYDIDSADTAFERLASLCATETIAEMREAAKTDAAGRIRRAEITWNRPGQTKASGGISNIVLGRILINGRRMSVEVNSARRATAIRREIKQRLASGARFKVDEVQDIDALIADSKRPGAGAKPAADQQELMRDPEVQARAADMIRRHWEAWVDMKLPALGAMTPRKAVKTADGREAVEALLAGAERSGMNDDRIAAMNREGIRLAKELLGLAEPSSGDE